MVLLTGAALAAPSAATRTADLNKLYADFWEENLVLNPLTATFAGDPRYNGELPNSLSPEYEKQRRAFNQAFLDRARAIGDHGLVGQDQLSFEIFTLNRQKALEGLKLSTYQAFGANVAPLLPNYFNLGPTTIHSRGWTREQTIDYMLANSPAEMTRAVSEAERFSAIPGQALAYKIGQLKIVELRQRAEKALGKKFDVRAFHDEVLKDGAVPLEVLEAKIDRWIAATR
jgi:uncharacterized protein (DUF885 family)